MPLRSWLRRLERRSKAGLESFALTDGSRYYYDPIQAYVEFALFTYNLIGGEEPEVPEAYRKLEKAADIRAALEGLRPPRTELALATPEETFDIEHLLEHRELLVRPHEPAQDLSKS
jgi:hypothetical protein